VVIFLTGASGFIGRRLASALELAGHQVIRAVRTPPEGAQAARGRAVAVDFVADVDPEIWRRRLDGVDVVVNAVGILRESGRQTFDAIHERAPRALFEACVLAGVKRIVQVSALGADERAASGYHLSKRRADDFLARLPVDWVIVQPSLVFGVEGTSARLFATLASAPWIPLPGRGEQAIQPIDVHDAIDALVALVTRREPARVRVALVGPAALTLREFLIRLRAVLELGRARCVSVPMGLVRLAAWIGAWRRDSLLEPDTLDMLARGNTADAAATRTILGREPREVERFLSRDAARAVRTDAQLRWLLPPLRWSIATTWIVTGIVSLVVWPREASLALLARTGVPDTLGPLMLYGAGALDLVLGVATLVVRRRRWWWLAQAVLIVLYTVVISVRLPEYWAHPYGPVLKNVPLLAAIALLYHLERR
jgi:uncharacterized protein YbjT (DUF2867 family)